MLFWLDSQLIIEGVMPNLLHIIPRGDNTVLNWILQSQDTSLRLSLISDVCILLSHTNHDTLMTWSTNNRWKDCSRCIISCKSCLYHTRSIVNNECVGFLTLCFFRF